MGDEVIPIIAVVAIFVVLPAMFLHYITEWKKMKSLSAQDEESFGDLRSLADRLDDRIRTMERILDDEVPDWRSRHYDR